MMSDQRKVFERQMEEALKDGQRWMAAIWTVREDGGLNLSTTTSQFPTGKFSDAVDILKAHTKTYNEEIPLPPPLPRAEGFEWMKDTFKENCGDVVVEKNCNDAGDHVVSES